MPWKRISLPAGDVPEPFVDVDDIADVAVAALTEPVHAGEVYYWPPGHTVRVDEDYEAIEFSPSGQMGELMNHLEAKLKG